MTPEQIKAAREVIGMKGLLLVMGAVCVLMFLMAPDISHKLPPPNGSLFALCAQAAAENNVPLVIWGQWTNVSTGTCSVDLQFMPGAYLQPGIGQIVTLSGLVETGATKQ